MDLQEQFYISGAVVSQAQEEWAQYIRAFGHLMDDMRRIHKNSDLLSFVRRFYALHNKIRSRAMIILLGSTDMNNPLDRQVLFEINNSFNNDRTSIGRALYYMRSTRLLVSLYSAHNESAWIEWMYSIADSIFADWRIGDDNKLYFSAWDETENPL
jgi:hypothetical protein